MVAIGDRQGPRYNGTANFFLGNGRIACHWTKSICVRILGKRLIASFARTRIARCPRSGERSYNGHDHVRISGLGTRPAAVVALLDPSGGAWYLPLILRPASMNHHAVQVGLPGGSSAPGESAIAQLGRPLFSM